MLDTFLFAREKLLRINTNETKLPIFPKAYIYSIIMPRIEKLGTHKYLLQSKTIAFWEMKLMVTCAATLTLPWKPRIDSSV